MGHYKNYIIMVMVYLFILSSISVVALATNNPAETQIDISETTPVKEPEIEVVNYIEAEMEETEPVTEPPTEEPTEPEVEETEPVTEPSVEPEPTEPEIDPDELEMLACVIYQEAGGDKHCDECRYRVGDVVLNRVEDSRFPDTMYKVLTAKAQYGRFYWTGIVWPDRASSSGEAHAVERAYAVAEDLLRGNHSPLYGEGYIWQAEFVQGSDNIHCCGHYFGR